MNHITCIKARRHGFTLIELLVVIAIIAVVMSLLISAVLAVLSVQVDRQNRKDLDDLHGKIEEFHQRYKVYPPSSIVVSNDSAAYQNTSFGLWSQQYLSKI